MEVLPVGPSAVLLPVDSAVEAASLAAHLSSGEVAVDVVPAARTVLLDGLLVPRSALDHLLMSWSPAAPVRVVASVDLPVVFDGEDLPFVASLWGCTVAEVVSRLTTTPLLSAFCGFAPGFAYLSGLGGSVPRLESPRARVPAGSVALAGEWAGVYPTASPGGWRLVGRTSAALWDVDRDPPALLGPGTRVRLVPSSDV